MLSSLVVHRPAPITMPPSWAQTAILRHDQLALRRHLVGWDFVVVLPGTAGDRRSWGPGAWLDPPVHEIHATSQEPDEPEVEILLNERDGDDWVFRRDFRIVRPLSKLGGTTAQHIPYLSPEIVLLYKAASPTKLDEADFAAAIPFLDGEQKRWLADAIECAYPSHRWSEALRP